MAAKKNEYPQSKGLRARLEAVLTAQSMCHTVLTNLKDVVVPELPGRIGEIVGKQVTDALAYCEVALSAIAGDE